MKQKVIDTVLNLLEEIEDALGVVMAPSELKREEMDTPNKIIEQVMKRI